MLGSENIEDNGRASALAKCVSNNGLDLIKQFEQLRLIPYRDVAGHWTIGYGHLILPGENFVVVSAQQAENLLQNDLTAVTAVINACVKVLLSQNEFDALASFTFNEGAAAFRGSTLLRKLNASDYLEAANQFLRWDKAMVDGVLVQLPGLLQRRQAERALFLQT